jgi:hypothetical protein
MSIRPQSAPPSLPPRSAGPVRRPAGELDRIEVLLRYSAWDLYRMNMVERWKRSQSADAPVISSSFPVALILYIIVQIFFDLVLTASWKIVVLDITLWGLILWGAWLLLAPYLEARREVIAERGTPPVRFVFSPEGVEIIRLDVSIQIVWAGIRRVRETWFSFLIYPRQQSPYISTADGRLVQVLPWMKLYFTIPKRCFRDASDERLFRSLLRQRLPNGVQIAR